MATLSGSKDQKLTKTQLEGLFEKAKNELVMLSEITNAMMQSLELDQVIYTILTALVSHEGLSFDRAFFFLVNEKDRFLEGKMAIGPYESEESDKFRRHTDNRKMIPHDLADAYSRFKKGPKSRLNNIVQNIVIPFRGNTHTIDFTVLQGLPLSLDEEPRVSGGANLSVTVPLRTRDRTLGVILVDNVFSRNPVTEDNVRILNMFAGHAALAIENSRLYEKTVHLSQTDWLTGLWNTFYFNDMLNANIKIAGLDKNCLSLLMLDIDNFKKYNDSLGHQEGDRAIKRIADILGRHCRNDDLVCRYGGEEFSIIMSGIDKNDGMLIGERLRREVENSFREDDSVPENLKLTISLGLAVYPADGATKNDLIRKADLALYRAKQTGKNRTCAAE